MHLLHESLCLLEEDQALWHSQTHVHVYSTSNTHTRFSFQGSSRHLTDSEALPTINWAPWWQCRQRWGFESFVVVAVYLSLPWLLSLALLYIQPVSTWPDPLRSESFGWAWQIKKLHVTHIINERRCRIWLSCLNSIPVFPAGSLWKFVAEREGSRVRYSQQWMHATHWSVIKMLLCPFGKSVVDLSDSAVSHDT